MMSGVWNAERYLIKQRVPCQKWHIRLVKGHMAAGKF
jgi:hypothetical protein